MGDINDTLCEQNILAYKRHVQKQIQDELLDSFVHLETHKTELNDLIHKIDAAKIQVECSISESRQKIQESFSSLYELLRNVIKVRETELLDQLHKIERESLTPLLDCKNLLCDSIQHTENLIEEGKLLTGDDDDGKPLAIKRDKIINFQKQAAANNCLPSVPDLYSVASVSVVLPSTTPSTLCDVIQQYGTINTLGPVQITAVQEKPGALLVQWDEVTPSAAGACDEDDDDLLAEEDKEFVLQCSNANESDPRVASYSTVYRGTDYQHLMQRIITGANYWLRVTHVKRDAEGMEVFMPWSLPKQCSTNLMHFKWEQCDTDWRSVDDGRLVSKHKSECSVVCSESSQVSIGDTITIQVVDGTDDACSDEGVAVCWQPPASPQQVTGPGTLFLSAAGCVMVDGERRLMQLPPLTAGVSVSFTIESVNNTKLRVYLETSGKQVTYEWPVPASLQKDPSLHFCACFSNPKWALRVY